MNSIIETKFKPILFLFIFNFVFTENVLTQCTTIREENRIIKTYPFGDPDPIPSLIRNSRIYPYFRFDKYSHTGVNKEWNVITMENPYIKVFILPEVGGKVWGAIEKSTDKEFIYLNHVLKFRDIAMRGPWTSGGIEFNFAIIGHAPSTGTPVDYITKENNDGSVSCIVGGIDLPSRTHWRVTITLPSDKAYFETQSFWYNPTPLNQSYYHWMNAAVKASDDLQFFYPGQYQIGHGGDSHPWPINENGCNVSYYKNNNFGDNKSYHVLGEYSEFYGGYYHDSDFGFGHWALYDDTPGKKLWIWSLSRSGAIWENLLTDTDGQYVEIQSGRQFSQAVINSSRTPFNQAFFAPYSADTWKENWFPVKEIGGIVDASPYGILNVTRNGDSLKIGVCALQEIDDNLVIRVGDKYCYTKHLLLKPMQVFSDSLLISEKKELITITVGEDKLRFTTDYEEKKLSRPITSDKVYNETSPERLFIAGEEFEKYRMFDEALDKYLSCLEKEQTHQHSLIRIAELFYRRAEHQKGLKYASQVLEDNTYNAEANFIYGITNRKIGDLINAKEALGWASRSMQYRSGAYLQIAEIYIQEMAFKRAIEYAYRALDYNKYNVNAYKILAIAYRKLKCKKEAIEVLHNLSEIDPLNHFSDFEHYLLDSNNENFKIFTAAIRNELPHETYLESAIYYANLGLKEEAVQVLKLALSYPIIHYWLAYLYKDKSETESQKYLVQAQQLSPKFVFPFRQETIQVLKWAANKGDNWKTKYYLGLLYWGKGRTEEAMNLFKGCGSVPDFAPFYVTRGYLFKNTNSEDIKDDFKRAVQVDKNDWRAWHHLNRHYTEIALFDNALNISEKAYNRFPDNYILGMDYARSLLNKERYKECLAILKNLNILPYEGAREGHDIFEQANLLLALENMQQGNHELASQLLEDSKEWPEHLGAGKPYNPDIRLQNYIAAKCCKQSGKEDLANKYLTEIYNYTIDNWTNWNTNHYIGAVILREFGETDKAIQLLEEWKKASGSEDVVVQWAVAKFDNGNSKAQELEKMLRMDERDAPWERTMYGNFRMLRKVVNAIDDQK